MKKILSVVTMMCIAICGIALADSHKNDISLSKTVMCSTHNHNSDRESCRYCNGHGTIDCNMCDATGWRTCSMCGGSGQIVYRNGDKETCENCSGKGKFKCGYCTRGQRKCDACKGTGVTRYVGE